MTQIPIVRYFNPSLVVTVLGQVVTFANGDGLNMRFRVRRTLTALPDECMVEIEGIDPVRSRLMGQAFAELGIAISRNGLIVQGGYDASIRGLFTGDLRTFKPRVQRGPSIWSICMADDGGDAYSDVPLRIPSTAGLTAQAMIDTAIAAMQLLPAPSVAQVLGTVSPAATVATFAATGTSTAAKLLDAACRRIRARWWIRDGLVHLGVRGLPDPTAGAVILTDQTIVEPETIDGSGIMSVGTLFDPNIVPGGQVAYLGSTFRVEQVIHSGETRGGSAWVSRITGRAL